MKGNISGIKDYIIKQLEEYEGTYIEKHLLISEELMQLITNITTQINKEINVSIDRKGKIVEISVGTSNTASIPNFEVYDNKLSGIRVVHTHPNGSSRLSDIDISALLNLKLDCIAAIGITDGSINGVSVGFCNADTNELLVELTPVIKPEDALNYDIFSKIISIDSALKKISIVDDETERAVIVGLNDLESLEELEELANACNVEVVGKFTQNKSSADNTYHIGSGKAKELALYRQVQNANLIIFDDELSGMKIKNLEDITGTKVIDRTILILEIFAKRAKSREAKIQVELAQLKHRSTRLIGYGNDMSRTGAGVGSKGPGEKKLELDRRKIQKNMHLLKQELLKIENSRTLQRKNRNKSIIPQVSLVGYTNVGKSTLRNLLVKDYSDNNASTAKEVFSEDMLFATLDATTRTILLPNNQIIYLTDTVGFIRKLPHDLIEAFKSTLEEVTESDVIVHVVDASNPMAKAHFLSVKSVLEELKADDKPTFIALNKIDLATKEQIEELENTFKEYDVIEISAVQNKNIDTLLNKIVDFLPNEIVEAKFLIPYSDSSLINILHKNSQVKEEEYLEDGIQITCSINKVLFDKYNKYAI